MEKVDELLLATLGRKEDTVEDFADEAFDFT